MYGPPIFSLGGWLTGILLIIFAFAGRQTVLKKKNSPPELNRYEEVATKWGWMETDQAANNLIRLAAKNPMGSRSWNTSVSGGLAGWHVSMMTNGSQPCSRQD